MWEILEIFEFLIAELFPLINEHRFGFISVLLADDFGNSINVESEKILEFEENDIVVVGGKYRKNSNLIISDDIIKVIVDKDGIRPSNDLEKQLWQQ